MNSNVSTTRLISGNECECVNECEYVDTASLLGASTVLPSTPSPLGSCGHALDRGTGSSLPGKNISGQRTPGMIRCRSHTACRPRTAGSLRHLRDTCSTCTRSAPRDEDERSAQFDMATASIAVGIAAVRAPNGPVGTLDSANELSAGGLQCMQLAARPGVGVSQPISSGPAPVGSLAADAHLATLHRALSGTAAATQVGRTVCGREAAAGAASQSAGQRLARPGPCPGSAAAPEAGRMQRDQVLRKNKTPASMRTWEPPNAVGGHGSAHMSAPPAGSNAVPALGRASRRRQPRPRARQPRPRHMRRRRRAAASAASAAQQQQQQQGATATTATAGAAASLGPQPGGHDRRSDPGRSLRLEDPTPQYACALTCREARPGTPPSAGSGAAQPRRRTGLAPIRPWRARAVLRASAPVDPARRSAPLSSRCSTSSSLLEAEGIPALPADGALQATRELAERPVSGAGAKAYR